MRDLRCIQGATTDKAAAQAIVRAVKAQAPLTFTCINYTRLGTQVLHSVTIVPIAPAYGHRTTLFRATSQPVAERMAAELHGSKRKRLGQPNDALSVLETQFPSPLRFGLANPMLSEHARVVTQSEPPYSVVWASPEWLALCKFSAVEILGRTLKCIQGPHTSAKAVGALMQAVRDQESVHGISLVNYDAMGRPFQHVLDIDTITSQGRVTAFMASSREVHLQEVWPSSAVSSGLNTLCADEEIESLDELLDMTAQASAERLQEEVEVWDDEIESVLYSWERLSLKCGQPGQRHDRRQPAAWA